MNKKEELLDKINKLNLVNPDKYGEKYNKGVRHSLTVVNNFFKWELIPEVPQYVADWYEEHKDDFEYSVFNYLYTLDDQECSVFKKWFVSSKTELFKVLVNMHQFGYTVEKEKRYLVKMKGMVENDRYLKYNKNISHWYFSGSSEYDEYRSKHTRKELEEAGFGEVFNSPLFEVEEFKEW